MSKKKRKYYTVWEGRNPGVYLTWEECQAQTNGFPEAKYKSFPTPELAEKAFKEGSEAYWGKKEVATSENLFDLEDYTPAPVEEAICVDAACSGNPGKMEYRGVALEDGMEMFHKGPFEDGTNNVGEFLAIVHALALYNNYEKAIPVYSDSKIAINWVKDKKCRTKLERTNKNAVLFDLIRRAEKWLETHTYQNPLLKWETKMWGEIPADFNRK